MVGGDYLTEIGCSCSENSIPTATNINFVRVLIEQIFGIKFLISTINFIKMISLIHTNIRSFISVAYSQFFSNKNGII